MEITNFSVQLLCALAVVVLTTLIYGAPLIKKLFPTPKVKDDTEPPYHTKVLTYVSYMNLIARGFVLEFFELLCSAVYWHRRAGRASTARAGPPLFSGWQCFYTKRLYGKIEDCWNRPITGQAHHSI